MPPRRTTDRRRRRRGRRRDAAAALEELRTAIPGWDLTDDRLPERLDTGLLVRAYRFSDRAHEGQTRRSGERYVTHCVEVARILAELGLDSVTVASGLIHDVVEDTTITVADVEREFGREVAQIVDGLTKIGSLSFTSAQERQVENYRKLLLSVANDARVVIIKLADRLHNMRTLEWLPEEKQKRIALETRDLYAPLAHRFGMARCGGSWRTSPSSTWSRTSTGRWPGRWCRSAASARR